MRTEEEGVNADVAAIYEAVNDETFLADLDEAIQDFHWVDIEPLSHGLSRNRSR